MHISFDPPILPVPLFSDNQGSIGMCLNPVQSSASKHIEVADHYARECVDRGFVTVSYVPTDKMVADILTKPLPPPKFTYFRDLLVRPIP